MTTRGHYTHQSLIGVSYGQKTPGSSLPCLFYARNMFAPAHHSFWLLIYLFLSYFVLSLPFMFVRLDLFFLCIHSSIVVSPARPVGKYPSFWFESIPHACCHTHNCFGLPGDQITMSLTWPFLTPVLRNYTQNARTGQKSWFCFIPDGLFGAI